MADVLAPQAVADIIRTTLGPRSMLKMLLDAAGGIVLTNDGHAILREIDVSHPAAKSIIQLSRAQDENVGDGTTSVIILAGKYHTLSALPLLFKTFCPPKPNLLKAFCSPNPLVPNIRPPGQINLVSNFILSQAFLDTRPLLSPMATLNTSSHTLHFAWLTATL